MNEVIEVSEMIEGFRCYTLPSEVNLFDELSSSVRFERVAKGRRGTVLVQPDTARGVPIVRTTTMYNAPAHAFLPLHLRLAQQIRELASLPVAFNNALIERYTNTYTKMGYHSDQAQDLEGGSSIAILSCYRDPERASPPRTLFVRSKEPEAKPVEIPMTHHSVVVFSVDTNRSFKHKIVLARTKQPPDNEWLGVTFRTSHTFVNYRDDGAYLESGNPLTLANEEQRTEFFKLRGRENREMNFDYPRLSYTISKSDRMQPQ
ncbi:MAG: alpha-ketoglutarate-dependent dioxygenase AlkB [Nannocystaceae bacterium]